MTGPRRAQVWVHDLEGVRVGLIGRDFLNLYHDDRLDTSETLNLTIAADHPKAALLIADAELQHDGRVFTVSEVESERVGTRTELTVEAEALWYQLGRINYVGSILLVQQTVAGGVTRILEGTGWNVSEQTSDEPAEFSLERQDQSVLSLLRSWANITGTGIVFDTASKTVALVDQRGADIGVPFRYRRNVKSVRRRALPPRITRIYPYGADGLTIAGVSGGTEYLEDLSWYTDQGVDVDVARERFTKSETYSDRSVLRDVELLRIAQERLADLASPTISYEMNVVDLSELIGVRENVTPADRVRVFDPDFGDDLTGVVTRYVRYTLEPWRNKIEIATEEPSYSDNATNSRPSASEEWVQFVGPVSAEYRIRSNATWTVARIPLVFRPGGRLHTTMHLFATGVGAGTMIVEILEADSSETIANTPTSIPYTDGQRVDVFRSIAFEDLEGQYDYRVRVTVDSDGGSSSSSGVDVEIDDVEADGSRAFWWVMAQGATQQAPTAANSVRYDALDERQSFTVPDNVTRITVAAAGARGGSGSFNPTGGEGIGGAGGTVTATFDVVPGTDFDVIAATSSSGTAPGFPDGGAGGNNLGSSNDGFAGGGSSRLIPAGGALADSWIVAPGGGGGGHVEGTAGGQGGFFEGGDGLGVNGSENYGTGATQTEGGANNLIQPESVANTFGTKDQGGVGSDTNSSARRCGGGGGGGWYGGGGGGYATFTTAATGAGGGGGGSGYVLPSGLDLLIQDGANADEGYVVISWETPDL